MQDLGLVYAADNKGKGCIVMMVVRRKSELAKTTMKRSVTTHKSKILTKRIKADVEAEGKRKPKQKESFMICCNKELQWYNKHGAMYSGKIKGDTKECMSENEYLKTKILELKASIKASEKVYILFYLFVLLDDILTHILPFVIQIKMQEAAKVTKLSNDLTVKLNKAENKIADKVINKTQEEKVLEKYLVLRRLDFLPKKERRHNAKTLKKILR